VSGKISSAVIGEKESVLSARKRKRNFSVKGGRRHRREMKSVKRPVSFIFGKYHLVEEKGKGNLQ